MAIQPDKFNCSIPHDWGEVSQVEGQHQVILSVSLFGEVMLHC